MHAHDPADRPTSHPLANRVDEPGEDFEDGSWLEFDPALAGRDDDPLDWLDDDAPRLDEPSWLESDGEMEESQ